MKVSAISASRPILFVKACLMVGMLATLSACSTLQFTYQQGPRLAYWWLDSYVDFNQTQAQPAKAALEEWFSWHRRSQLSAYAQWLESTRTKLQNDVTSAQVCQGLDDIQQRWMPAYQQAVPAMARLVATFTAAQFTHLEQHYEKLDAELAQDYLQRDEALWQAKSQARWLRNLEDVYGDFDAAQQQRLADLFKALPFDPALWIEERRLRHADIVRSLRQLVAQRAGVGEIEAALLRFGQAALRSPRHDYRVYRTRLLSQQCVLVAEVHQHTTARQRSHAAERLQAYAQDFRSLAASPP